MSTQTGTETVTVTAVALGANDVAKVYAHTDAHTECHCGQLLDSVRKPNCPRCGRHLGGR